MLKAIQMENLNSNFDNYFDLTFYTAYNKLYILQGLSHIKIFLNHSLTQLLDALN